MECQSTLNVIHRLNTVAESYKHSVTQSCFCCEAFGNIHLHLSEAFYDSNFLKRGLLRVHSTNSMVSWSQILKVQQMRLSMQGM